MTIPLIPFEGHMSYCLTRCLQMVLAHRGNAYALSWLECVSGEPFGFVYGRGEYFIFAVNAYPYHLAGEHLLRTLDYAYTYSSSADATTARDSLKDALQAGPVIAGMLDMGFLTYIPNHDQLHGSDHAVIVHDPEGYAAVPLDDFLGAWQRDIYTGKPYGLWRMGTQGHPPTEENHPEEDLDSCMRQFRARSAHYC